MIFHKNLLKVVSIYVTAFLFINFIFGLIYFQIDSMVTEKPENRQDLLSWLYFSMTTFVTVGYGDITPLRQMWPVVSLQFIFSSIILPISGGLIFYSILNRPATVVFPKRLIVRKRTSEGVKNSVTLSVKIANTSQHRIYDVQCKLFFFYFTNTNGVITRNAHTILNMEVPYVDKTYRFSFDLVKFPATFLRSLLDLEPMHQNDLVSIVIQGKRGTSGDFFLTDKDYTFPDIVIGKDTEKLYSYRLLHNNRITKTIIDYGRLDNLIEYTPEEIESLYKQVEAIIFDKEEGEEKRLAKLHNSTDRFRQ